ncbi:MAG: hypothetical protein U5K54_27080 [Cytophagales bacterium]|nr:hypothetical protein [Cytophagales bacterium]
MALGEALTGQGYFTEAVQLLNEQERYFIGKAVKQETFVDEKGNLKSRKLSDEEMTVRFNDYANMLTLLGNAYGNSR